MNKKTWIISEKEKDIIASILLKGKKEQEKNKHFSIIKFEDFYNLFTFEEIIILKKFLSIDPQKIGYKLPFIGINSTSDILFQITNQKTYFEKNKQIKISCQYLPKKPLRAYMKLNKAIKKDINKNLLIDHGYRSPARQVFIFFDKLANSYDFDITKTLKRVSLPDYSEHVCIKKQAIDFMTENGVKGDGFEKTGEYKWLKLNANKFGFYESYPENNKLDMTYEPWHWHYES